MPSIISAVIRNGTRSGTGKSLPCHGSQRGRVDAMSDHTDLIKSYAEIDVNNFSSDSVQQDVGKMSISQTKYVANDGGSRHTARIRQSHRKPSDWVLVPLGEIMPHDRSEFFAQAQEQVDDRLE
jgi:hypothetical protein